MLRSRTLRTQRIAACIYAIIVSAIVGASARAHDGHDHGPPAPALPTTVKPRLSVHSDLYELVAILQGSRLAVFLDRYATNEPVTDASITAMAGPETLAAKSLDDGTYRIDLPALSRPGRHELIFTISHKLGDDLLAGEILVPDMASEPRRPADGSAVTRRLSGAGYGRWPLALALAAGLALGSLLRTRAALALIILVATGIVLASGVSAHDGHDHSPAPSGDSLTGDIPRRLPDGSVFLPKPSQRLLSVRSQIAVAQEVEGAKRLLGRIIADPNRSGLVQSINGGRISAPQNGLPTLGQAVVKGQVLANVTPALPLADQSTIAEKQRELEGALTLAHQRFARLSRIESVTPRAQLQDIEQEIASLEQRLATLGQTKVRPESLEAPIDGIVAASRVASGQVVQAQDILFQIIDPASLWVEAFLFDPLDPSAIKHATASMPDGRVVQLEYKGRGRALQAQSALIQFSMREPPASALIGLPVTVYVRSARTSSGILLPRDAVVRGAGGEGIVWQHVDPERFVARPVRVEPFDGAHVVITAGIGAKDRIVVHAAELLSQIR